MVKFRGAGQGPQALVAELVAGEIGAAAGLPVPELVFVELDPQLGAAEPDPEIQDLIARQRGPQPRRSTSCPGSLAYNPARRPGARPGLAAAIVWLDALVTNVDRTPQTPTCSSGTGGSG